MELTYREQIIESINKLIETRYTIFEQIINLAMSNEFSHLKDVFDQGDIYSFSLNHFEDVEDVNVQKMIVLCKKTEEIIFTIMDLNGINENEVNLND
ncbi:hypothetical protein [Chryseobacterium echinoideorum]|uniref:hypothetical protein n=1 Tax=Chryseobacterium echinoideorum TaxID=1549648 RepID=UPI0011868790|nr:hypothetical protein [Chryseobacterium echinoideorum]